VVKLPAWWLADSPYGPIPEATMDDTTNLGAAMAEAHLRDGIKALEARLAAHEDLAQKVARFDVLLDQVEAILAALTIDETKGGGSLSRETLRTAGALRQAFLRVVKK